MKTENKIENHNEIVNSLLAEKRDLIQCPPSLKKQVKQLSETIKIDMIRITTESLLKGIKDFERKYSLKRTTTN